jgi:hypothetical protein
VQLYEGLLATDTLFVLGSQLRPHQQRIADFDAGLDCGFQPVADAVAAKQPVDIEFVAAGRALWPPPRTGAQRCRPADGVSGDIYTSLNPAGDTIYAWRPNLGQRLA